MLSSELLVLGVLVSLVWGHWEFPAQDFPPGFKFGAASSSYQVEGAWNVSDKAESIWDRFTHEGQVDGAPWETGDVACDSYHQWRRDIDMASELGLDFYRFSISWPRLLPSGFTDYISEDGKNYYDNLINGLLERGIEPAVTIYHFDLPQNLQEYGGWINPRITDWFADYARVVFSLYADRVKIWFTINEPNINCELTYIMGTLAPGIVEPTFAPFICNKNMLVAHAKAWRIYNEEYRHLYHGKLGLVNQLLWFEPATENDKGRVNLAQEFLNGRYSHPIYSKAGGWPPVIEKLMADYSRKQGFPFSRLPSFTQEEIELIRGTYDFYGFNYYTSRVVRAPIKGEKIGRWFFEGSQELDLVIENRPDWKFGASLNLPINPEGLRLQLQWLRQHYGDMEIMIMENGFSSYGFDLNDDDRIKFIRDHLEQIQLAVQLDRINVTAYTVWSLMDNFEWIDGYGLKFGLYEVNFNHPNRTRTMRKSAHYYSEVIRARSLNVPVVSDAYDLIKYNNCIDISC